MDQVAAINLANSYLMRVKQTRIPFSEAWLFGSYAKETANDSSDIDLAGKGLKTSGTCTVNSYICKKNHGSFG
jgi:predicted nucleotidyltransferase